MPNNSNDHDDQRRRMHSHPASLPIISDDGAASPPLVTYENNVLHGNSRGTFSSTTSYNTASSDHYYPFGSPRDYLHNKEDAAIGPAYYHDQRSRNIPLDDKQKQEWTEKQQLASFQSSHNNMNEDDLLHHNALKTNSYHDPFLFGRSKEHQERRREPRYHETNCNFESSNVEVASDPPLYFSTIDNKSMVYEDYVTSDKNAQFDRRARCIEKGGFEKSQTEHMNCERLESLDYTLSNDIYQSSLPDVGASFRDIFNEDEERKAASDIFVQYPKKRIQKRRSMDLSTHFDRNEVDRNISFFMPSNWRRKKLHQNITPDPVSMSAHDSKTSPTIATTTEEYTSTEKAYSAPISISSYNHSRLRFYDTRFLRDMTENFPQQADIHEKSTKEKSKSSYNPLCKPTFPLVQSTGIPLLKQNVETSISCRTLPCFHEADHSTESIKSEKAYSAPIPTEFLEDPSELKQKRESFYDNNFLDEIPSYEKLYTEEEQRLSPDVSPPEEVPQAKPVLKTKSRSRVQNKHDPSMLLYEIDDENATRFSYFIFSQIEICSLTESDNKGKRFGLHEIGYKGMACKYCQGKSGKSCSNTIKSGRGGRYFPKSIKTMADTTKTLMSIANHLKQCKNVPTNMKKVIIELEETHKEEQKAKPRGCHSNFCKQMWERLHGASSPLKKKNRKQS